MDDEKKRLQKYFPLMDADCLGVWYFLHILADGTLLYGRSNSPRYSVKLKKDDAGLYAFDRSTVVWLDETPDNPDEILDIMDDPSELTEFVKETREKNPII